MDNTGYTHQAHMAKKNHVPAMNHNFQKVQNPKPEISTSQKNSLIAHLIFASSLKMEFAWFRWQKRKGF